MTKELTFFTYLLELIGEGRTMIRISHKCDYALKIILDLANYYQKNLVRAEDIAKRKNIPQNFLEQILLELKKGGFVESRRGPKGGYLLARDPERITMGDVIRFIEGDINLVAGRRSESLKTENSVQGGGLAEIWDEVADSIAQIVDHVNFVQILKREAEISASNAANYMI